MPLQPIREFAPSDTLVLEPCADVDRACRAVHLVLRYDSMRLRVYAERAGNPEGIVTRRFGSATALQFPAVGYFNQVYQFGESDLGRLGEITQFFHARRLAFKMHVAAYARRDIVFARLERERFQHRGDLVYLVRDALVGDEPRPATDAVALDPVRPSERERFFRIYLECFGADPAKHADALRNMTLLYDEPSLHCIFARVDGEIAGIAMLFVEGKSALLCAGATLPAYRRSGCQTALIRHRINMARELGCDALVSWTERGSRSHENLLACGFETALVDPVWWLPPPAAERP